MAAGAHTAFDDCGGRDVRPHRVPHALHSDSQRETTRTSVPTSSGRFVAGTLNGAYLRIREAPGRCLGVNNTNGADRIIPEANTDSSLSANTAKNYGYCWQYFDEFCNSHHLSALPASADAVLAYVGAAKAGILRRPGKRPLLTGEPAPFSASQVDVVLAAVRDRHVRAGLQSPTDDPAVKAVRKQYRIDWEAAHSEKRAIPLTVEALRACVEYRPEVSLPALTKAAAALLLVDKSCTSALELSRLRLSDLRCEREVELRVDGKWREIACTCTHFAKHWLVRPCAACLLRRLEAELSDEDEALFGWRPRMGDACARQAQRLSSRIKDLARSLPRAWPAIRYAGSGRLVWTTNDAEVRAATLHGIGLRLTDQLHLLQMRTLLNVSFARGLRFSDAQRLSLTGATRLPNGSRLLLPVSKGDQQGQGRWLQLYPASDCSLCPVCALDEWLWVRCVAAQSTRPAPLLLCGIGRLGLSPESRVDYATFWMRLKPIRETTGAGDFSLHSMRRGFAALAQEQGATEHQVQQSLAHKKLDTTKRYLDAGLSGEIPSPLQRLAGNTAASPKPPKPVDRAPRPAHRHADHGCSASEGCAR